MSSDGVTRNVVGMDLHPVAVTLARVTYLLAIGPERLAAERNPIRVPVFLGDSMQWRNARSSLWSAHELRVPVNDQRELTESETHTRTIETFFGAGLLDWARVCIGVGEVDRARELIGQALTAAAKGGAPGIEATIRCRLSGATSRPSEPVPYHSSGRM